MTTDNYFKLKIPALSRNESYARAVCAAFAAQCDPTLQKLQDIRAAVSEAVTNCIVHAYKNRDITGEIEITGKISAGSIYIKVRDKGCGIADIKQALTPLFTTDRENERSGLGFTVIEDCADYMRVSSKPDKGTLVTMRFDTDTQNE